MREALHPTQNHPITVLEYIQLFGTRLDHLGNKNIRPPARCPACNEDTDNRTLRNKTAQRRLS